MASKVTFRARALDQHKPMPVYLADELVDLAEYAAVNRAVPAMPTGMEKEEEMELHLVEAMTAQQLSNVGGCTDVAVVIPTPRVTSDVPYYEHVYAASNCRSDTATLVKVEASLNVEPELCEYDADSEDEQWLKTHPHDIGAFEAIMDRLERNSERQVVTLKEIRYLLQNQYEDDVLQTVYDYWVEKRLRVRHALCPRVRNERRELQTQNASTVAVASPYVAFRRRAEKMQTRKNRKNDEDGYEKILKLSSDLRKASVLLQMMQRREKTKRELINMQMEVVDRQNTLHDWSGALLRECEREARPMFSFVAAAARPTPVQMMDAKKSERKRKSQRTTSVLEESRTWLSKAVEEWHRTSRFPTSPPHTSPLKQRHGASAINGVLELVDQLASTSTSAPFDGEFMFKRRRGCVYHAPQQTNTTADVLDDHSRLHRTYLHHRAPGMHSAQLRYIGMARRRLGRGGRVIFDRAVEDRPDTTNAPPSSNDYYQPRCPPTLSALAQPSADPTLTSAVAADDDDSLSLVCSALAGASACAIDSGYSSPASVRSRSLQRNGTNGLRPPPIAAPYALVKGPRGDICQIPITVGVSPALFGRHVERVAQMWPRQWTASDSQSSSYEQPISPIDRVHAFQACAAVQSASFADGFMATGPRSTAPSTPAASVPTTKLTAIVTNGDGPNGDASNNSHHPLPTPSPSPNDDTHHHHHAELQQRLIAAGTATKMVVADLVALDDATKSPPQSDADEHQLMLERYARTNGQAELVKKQQAHQSNNTAVR